jgi:hypothetical protein
MTPDGRTHDQPLPSLDGLSFVSLNADIIFGGGEQRFLVTQSRGGGLLSLEFG